MENFLENLNSVMEVQLEFCKENAISDESMWMYNIGLYNGMALAKAIFLGNEPGFFDGEKIRRKSEDEK